MKIIETICSTGTGHHSKPLAVLSIDEAHRLKAKGIELQGLRPERQLEKPTEG